jgi:hypothetical protein
MQQRARYSAAVVCLLLGVSGCPVTDDYYLLSADAAGGGGSSQAGSSAEGGSSSRAGSNSGAGQAAQAASSNGGNAAAGGVASSGSAAAGASPDPSQAGMPMTGEGGAPAEPCVPTTERCNGHDDDCDESIDEFVCLSNCSGFVLASDPDHGYMFCNAARKADYDNAKQACEDQDMRLAWLTSSQENAAVVQRLDSLGSDAEVLFGATDQGNEGDWIWAGGQQFWEGDDHGQPVGGLYSNWLAGTPNNSSNEDCALVIIASGKWGDRSCDATYPYLCEQPD